MRINHNISAMITQGALTRVNLALSKSLERLSTGLRINRASDDAAGLGVSENLRTQVRGLNQANKNVQDGTSLIQIAEGALNEIHSNLQRMRELSIQAANDTLTDVERDYIQEETDALIAETQRITEVTNYNKLKVFRDFAGNGLYDDLEGGVWNADGRFDPTWPNWQSPVEATPAGAPASWGSTSVHAWGSGTSVINSAGSAEFSVDVQFIGDRTTIAVVFGGDANGSWQWRTNTTGFMMPADSVVYDGALNNVSSTPNIAVDGDYTNLRVTVDDAGNYECYQGGVLMHAGNMPGYVPGDYGIWIQAFGGGSARFDNFNYSPETVEGGCHIQAGANAGDGLYVRIPTVTAGTLGVSSVDNSTQSGAVSGIETLKTAIDQVSSYRTDLGAYINRLEHTVNNIYNGEANQAHAESIIRDADFAFETTGLVRNQILASAGTAMLTQANMAPNTVLGLLQ